MATKKLNLLIFVVAPLALLWVGCQLGGEKTDAGVTGSVDFHSMSEPIAPAVEPAVDVELVELAEPVGPEIVDEPVRSDELMEVAFRHGDEEPVDHLSKAGELIERKDFAPALMELAKALYDDPANYEAAYLLGKTALMTGEKDVSRKAFELASGMDPEKADAWIQLGRIAMSGKDLNRAADCARQAISADAGHAQAYNLQGRIWLARSHWDRAIVSYRKAVSLSPDSRYFRNNLGLAYLMKKDYGNAVDVLEKVVSSGDVPAFMHNNLGLAYEGAGRLLDAQASFETAVEANPRYVNAKINLDRLTTLAKRFEASVPAEAPVEAPVEEAVWEEPAEPDKIPDDLIIVEP